ncbi:MAG: ankyrin repeat domain-containing protein [Gammaproteobacteria bacterium]
MKKSIWLIPLFTGLYLQAAWANDNAVLIQAAQSGNTAKVTRLLAHGANVNARDKYGISPLDWAAWYGYKNIVEVLLAHGANVNARDIDGNTPLSEAAHNDHLGVAKVLVAHGADVKTHDRWGVTPLDTANDIQGVNKSNAMLLLLLHNNAKAVQAWDNRPVPAWDESLSEMLEEGFRADHPNAYHQPSCGDHAGIEKAIHHPHHFPISQRARRHFVMGITAFKDATDSRGFDRAIRQFQGAVERAPQWADAWYNLALAQEARGHYQAALSSIDFYRCFHPNNQEIRDKRYELEEKVREENGGSQ